MAIATGTALALGAAATAGSTLYSVNAQKKAASAAANAAANSQVDIQRLDQTTRDIAMRNARDAAQLEAELTPEVPELRRMANLAVLAGLAPDARQEGAVDSLYGRLNTGLQTPLLQAAIDRAQSDLALGGKLDRETMNAASRAAGARAGTTFGGLGLGRDLAARDLGLTSYQVGQQRLQNASQLGALELNKESFDATNFLNTFNALQNYNNAKRSYALGAAQYGESIAPPVVGLDPSAAANVAVGNQNASNQAAANQANLAIGRAQTISSGIGQLAGLGLMASMSAPTTQVPQTQLATPASLATPINTSITPNFSYYTR